MGTVEGSPHANPATRGLVLPLNELQLDLELVRVRVTRVRGLEDCAGVAAARHEQLGGVVDLGELISRQLPGQLFLGSKGAYLAANHGADAVGDVVDDAVNQGQVVRGHTNGTNEEMPIAAACFFQVHVLVVHFGAAGILDLSAERVGDGVGEGVGGDGAGRRYSGPGEQGLNGFPVHHLVGGRQVQGCLIVVVRELS